jgi:hypothetical protein
MIKFYSILSNTVKKDINLDNPIKNHALKISDPKEKLYSIKKRTQRRKKCQLSKGATSFIKKFLCGSSFDEH